MPTKKRGRSTPQQSIYAIAKKALVARGWTIKADPELGENDEPLEFVPAEGGKPLTWIEALLSQYYEREQN